MQPQRRPTYTFKTRLCLRTAQCQVTHCRLINFDTCDRVITSAPRVNHLSVHRGMKSICERRYWILAWPVCDWIYILPSDCKAKQTDIESAIRISKIYTLGEEKTMIIESKYLPWVKQQGMKHARLQQREQNTVSTVIYMEQIA